MVRLLDVSPQDFHAQLQGKKLFLFGAGRACAHFHEVFCRLHPVDGIVDNARELWGTRFDCNGQSVPVLSLPQFVQEFKGLPVGEALLLVTPVFAGLKIIGQLDAIADLDGLPCCLGALLRFFPVARETVRFTTGAPKIPKKIHYCWFGGSSVPSHLQKYIDGWKRLCPDYKIVEWNERNYDVFKNPYMGAAYRERRWGFVPDYARIDIVHEHGGIYLDTDVELLRRPDVLLNDDAFFGFNYNDAVNLGIGFGAVPMHPLLRAMRDYYDGKSFFRADGSLNLSPCYVYQHPVLKDFGFSLENRRQEIRNVVLYPSHVLASEGMAATEDTVSIHHGQYSWAQAEERELFASLRAFVSGEPRTARGGVRKYSVIRFPVRHAAFRREAA